MVARCRQDNARLRRAPRRDYAAHLGAGLPKYLVMPEAGLVLSYIDDLTAQMYFETLWNTGARFNEALALTPACFTLEP